MIRLGPITIMRSERAQAYRRVVEHAWLVHETIWAYGENNEFPAGLKDLPLEDALLSEALSRTPAEDAPV